MLLMEALPIILIVAQRRRPGDRHALSSAAKSAAKCSVRKSPEAKVHLCNAPHVSVLYSGGGDPLLSPGGTARVCDPAAA